MGTWRNALLLTFFWLPLAAGAAAAEDGAIALTMDDDLFSAPGHDRDYTGGIALTISGETSRRLPVSIDPLLARLDRAWREPLAQTGAVQHALSVGIMAFTPEDVAAREPVPGDRPYASLVYLSSARRYLPREGHAGRAVYNSQLVIGVLGLDVIGQGHQAIHRLTGSDPLRGYAHQISAGGEPTLRYSLARQALIGHASANRDYKWTLAGSAGTVTEGSLAFNARWGQISSPWWSYAPEQNTYAQDTQPLTRAGAETFVAAGVRLRLRAYNAFLQGQFRDSALRYEAEDLHTVLGEAWTGVVMRRPSGFEIRYLARWSSPELKHGPGARDMLWGSVEFVLPLAL